MTLADKNFPRKLFCLIVSLMFLTSLVPVNAQTSPPATPPQPPAGTIPNPTTVIPSPNPTNLSRGTDISTPAQIQPLQPPDSSGAPLYSTTIKPDEAQKNFAAPTGLPFPGPACMPNNLTDREANNLFNLVRDGFLGQELSGDADQSKTKQIQLGNEKRDELQNNKVILENPSDPKQSAKAQLPSKEIKPYEVSNWMNVYLTGPFAFGLVLDDTVRAGRCADANTTDCFLVGKNLKLRNDGAGIVADAKPFKDIYNGAADKIKGLFTGTDKNASKSLALTDDDQKIIGAGLFTSVDDGASVKTAQRLEKELIPNSMLTKDFDAKMGTNCVSEDCIISTYSMFDKYFNQWMSSEMVATTFGPSLLGRTKKLFNWVGRRNTFFRGVYDNIADKFRVAFESPDSLLGSLKLNRMHQRVDKNGWRKWFTEDFMGGKNDGTGYPLIKTFEFQAWWGQQQVKDGFLDSINTVQKKAELIRVLKDLRTYTRAANAPVFTSEKKYQGIVDGLLKQGISNPYDHPEAKKALIDYGRSFGKLVEDYDDDLGLDGPAWFVHTPNIGVYNKGVRQVNTGEVIDLGQEHRNYRILLNKFVDSGDFSNFENEAYLYRSAYETDGKGNLVLYGFNPANGKSAGHMEHAALSHQEGLINDLWAKLDNGEYMRVTPESGDFIKARTTGNVDLFQGNWEPIQVLTPEEFALRLTNGRVRPNFTTSVRNVEQMLDTLKEKNWVSRRYWNALDKLMAQEDELIRSYFSIRGGIKWTAYPFGYWWVKKGGGGAVEDLSFYQLPDTWSYVLIKHGTQAIYDYAYVDFFANAGSDQGDIFVQVLNKLPWKQILDEVSNKFEPTRKLFDKITGKELRNETENIAFYLTGPQQCDNCSMKIETDKQFQTFRPFFVAKNTTLSSYILEDTQSQSNREKGQTLIAFAHKANLEGKSGDIPGGKIDIFEASQNQSKPTDTNPDLSQKPQTCKDAILSLPGYSTIDKLTPYLTLGLAKELPKDQKIAAVLGGVQSLAYVTFFWPGVFTSVAVQTLYAPKLQDCVDADEGYFIHYFLAAKKEQTSSQQGNKVEKSSEKVSNLVDKLKTALTGALQGTDINSVTKEKVQSMGDEINKLIQGQEETRIVQANLQVKGNTQGQFKGVKLFYIWCGPGCEKLAGEYRTIGHEKVEDKFTGNNIDIDYQKGQLLKNGEPIVTNPDAVRLSALNSKIPAEEIPRRLNTMCIEPSKAVGIEISANGVASIRDPEIQRCISGAVLAQTGLPLSQDNDLSSAFGLVKSVATVTHPNISFQGDQIIAEGIPRKIATGSGASLKILNDKSTTLSHSNDGVTDTGIIKAIQFENGQMIMRPDGCYAVWLRHHQDGVLNQNDVTGIRPKLTTSINPENGCAEPAIDLSAIANPNSSYLQDKVSKFNTSLQKMGPFQIFETPTKRYVLYSEKDAAGTCQDHLKVLDKETGKTEDFTGKASQTPNGIAFTTNDGKTHTLDFGAPNGVPQVAFDDKAPETLTSAQGKNGSFYYDPNTGQWYAENGQLLPLIEAFKDGISTKVGPNNTTTSNAAGNVLNLQVGDNKGGFLNLPSVPENNWMLLLFVAGLVATFLLTRTSAIRYKTKHFKK